jgi:hypothetical protein
MCNVGQLQLVGDCGVTGMMNKRFYWSSAETCTSCWGVVVNRKKGDERAVVNNVEING